MEEGLTQGNSAHLVSFKTQEHLGCMGKMAKKMETAASLKSRYGSFPTLGILFWGVPVISIIIFWGLHWGPLVASRKVPYWVI